MVIKVQDALKNKESGNSPNTGPSLPPCAQLLIRGRVDIRAVRDH